MRTERAPSRTRAPTTQFGPTCAVGSICAEAATGRARMDARLMLLWRWKKERQ